MNNPNPCGSVAREAHENTPPPAGARVYAWRFVRCASCLKLHAYEGASPRVQCSGCRTWLLFDGELCAGALVA